MIISLMAYGTLVSVLIGGAALAGERAFAVRSWPRRWLWALSLVVSLTLPITMMLSAGKSREATPAVSPTSRVTEIAASAGSAILKGSTATAVTTPSTPAPMAASIQRRQNLKWPALPDFDRFLKYAWIGASLALLWFYVAGWVGLRRNVRRWPVATVDGGSVRVTESIGPAVLGYFSPQVLIPRWVMSAPPSTRSMMLMHEREHIAAGDSILLLAALLLMVLVPWNGPMWWQIRRLRFALEVDCDARVLRRGAEARAYGEMLLTVGQHQGRVPHGAMALTEPISQLERRIRAFMEGSSRHSRRITIGVVLLSASLIAVAAELTAPALNATSELRKLPPEDMSPGAEWARYTARAHFPELFDREFSGRAVISIVFNRDGTVVSAQKTLYPEGVIPPVFSRPFQGRPAPAGMEGQDVLYQGDEDSRTIGPWLESKNRNRIDVLYTVLKWTVDPTRSAARVEAAVREHSPELFQGDMANRPKLSTVFMNDDGSVNRIRTEITDPGWSTTVAPDAIERVTSLGVGADEIGRRGFIGLRPPYDGQIGYAWPRRPDDGHLDEGYPRGTDPRQDTADDGAIMSRYFADASMSVPRKYESGWLLLGRDGHIWASGRGVYQHSLMLPGEMEARFPGIKVQPAWSSCLSIPAAGGTTLPVNCVWLAADSPVTELAGVDFTQRPDVLITVYLVLEPYPAGGKPHIFESPVYLKFGKPGVGAMFLDRLHVTAGDLGALGVELRLRLNSYYKPAVTLDETTIRVRYGESADVQLKGEGVWPPTRLVLRPSRVDFPN